MIIWSGEANTNRCSGVLMDGETIQNNMIVLATKVIQKTKNVHKVRLVKEKILQEIENIHLEMEKVLNVTLSEYHI